MIRRDPKLVIQCCWSTGSNEKYIGRCDGKQLTSPPAEPVIATLHDTWRLRCASDVVADPRAREREVRYAGHQTVPAQDTGGPMHGALISFSVSVRLNGIFFLRGVSDEVGAWSRSNQHPCIGGTGVGRKQISWRQTMKRAG
jgi:hypothetical protein